MGLLSNSNPLPSKPSEFELPENITRLKNALRACTLCPRNCRVDRSIGQRGACGIAAEARVASTMPHFGEESVLVGRGGSGTIFFAGCNLHCAFCQNYDISQTDSGRPCSPRQIAELALSLAQDGCENINFVTPTHVAHAVAEAIVLARHLGLTLPTVYNCGGYESLNTLRSLEGLIDIYMPDFKYAADASGRTYSEVDDYPTVAAAALAEMFRQTGPLQIDQNGLARRGLLVRHLVLPHNLADSQKVIDLIAQHAPGCTVNIMAQYRHAFRAHEFPELMEYPSRRDIQDLRQYADTLNLVVL